VRGRRNRPGALKLNLPGRRGSFANVKTQGRCALAEDFCFRREAEREAVFLRRKTRAK